MIFGRGSTAGSHVARLSANVELLWALHRQLLQSLERNGQLPVGDQDIATCFGGIVRSFVLFTRSQAFRLLPLILFLTTSAMNALQLEHLEIYLAFSASFRDLMVVVDSAILNLESSFAQTGYSRSDLVLHLQRPLQHLQAYPLILTVRQAHTSLDRAPIFSLIFPGATGDNSSFRRGPQAQRKPTASDKHTLCSYPHDHDLPDTGSRTDLRVGSSRHVPLAGPGTTACARPCLLGG